MALAIAAAAPVMSLRAAGEISHARTPQACDQLTPQELQIARMAAEGLTSNEIGRQLPAALLA
jgi:DNA-binding CsgD family transcriptional regulator